MSGDIIVLCWLYSLTAFLIFCLASWSQIGAPAEVKGVLSNASVQKTFAENVDPGALIEKVAKLVDALGKIGPEISALAASIIFVGPAAYIVTAEPHPPGEVKRTGEAPQQADSGGNPKTFRKTNPK
jgi:hypothetical protein